jgi:hypothetical protein
MKERREDVAQSRPLTALEGLAARRDIAKAESPVFTGSKLKGLIPEDAKEAIGHGVRAKRSKSGAVSFDLLEVGRGIDCRPSASEHRAS